MRQSVLGGTGNDTLSIFGGSVEDDVNGEDGNDLIIFNVSGNADNARGGDGDDTVSMAGGVVRQSVLGGTGNDTLSIFGGSVEDDVNGEDGNDLIIFNVSGNADNARGGDGDDTVSMAGGVVRQSVLGGTGNDTLSIFGGSVEDDVNGEDGNDLIIFNASGNADNARGGDGDDTVSIAGGVVRQSVLGGTGNDTLSIFGGSVEDDVNGEDGNDLIIFDVSGNADNARGGDGDDTVSIAGGNVRQSVLGGSGNDLLSINGSVGDDVNGEDGDDRIVFDGTADNLFGASGNDTITMVGGRLRNAGPLSGGQGNDTITVAGGSGFTDLAGDTGDDFLVVQANIPGNVLGGSGNDTVLVQSGQVGLSVLGGAGNDTLSIADGSVADDVNGEDGNDLIVFNATADKVFGASGNDTITMVGGLLRAGGPLSGGDGDDTISVAGGSGFTDVAGDSGNDLLVILADVPNNVLGGVGDDTVVVQSGRVALAVLGGSGNDFLSIAGGSVGGNVDGGSGSDPISLVGGSVNDVLGSGGNDVIVLQGAAITHGSILGGDGNDLIGLKQAGDVSGLDVFGGSGNDAVEVGPNFSPALSGVDSLFGGAGAGDFIAFSGFDGLLSKEFGQFESLHLLSGTTLDVHNPSAIDPDDRDLSAGAEIPMSVFIGTGSALVANGNSPGTTTINGNVGNLGGILMQDSGADDIVTITGNYAGGASGVLTLDAALDASEQGDMLVIGGGVQDVNVPQLVAEGTTTVAVNDLGDQQTHATGTGPGKGIAVIDVSATGNTDDDDFVLGGGPVRIGAVLWDLVLESDGIWYLQSEFLGQAFGYAAAPSAIGTMQRDYVGNLQERVGARQQSWTGGATQISDGSGVWLRSGGSFGKVKTDSDYEAQNYDQDHWFAQLGADIVLLADPDSGHLIGTVMGQAGTSKTTHDKEGNELVAEDHIQGYGGGLALTWYAAPQGWEGDGLYVDAVGQVTFYNLETKVPDGGQRGETDGWGWSISLEAGYGINLGGERDGPRLIPQIQLVYSQVMLDDFTDEDGIDVDFDDADSLEGRIGLAVDSGKMWRSVNAYAEANLVHEFLGDTETRVELGAARLRPRRHLGRAGPGRDCEPAGQRQPLRRRGLPDPLRRRPPGGAGDRRGQDFLLGLSHPRAWSERSGPAALASERVEKAGEFARQRRAIAFRLFRPRLLLPQALGLSCVRPAWKRMLVSAVSLFSVRSTS